MHEAGLARAVAATLRERGLDPADVRLLVRGGHHGAAEFDASLRTYLAAELPGAGADGVPIVHLPVEHLCLGCGSAFQAAEVDAACPSCGGASLSAVLDEQVEIELP